MNKLKILIMVLFVMVSANVFAETSLTGSQWKQEGTTLIPADDVTAIDLSGVSGGTLPGPTDSYAFDVISGNTVRVGAGTLTDPSIQVLNSDYGFYKDGSGLSVKANGVKKLGISTNYIIGGIGGGTLKVNNSTVAIPGLLPDANDINTGIHGPTDDTISIVAGGVETFKSYTTYAETFPSGSGQVTITDEGSISVDGGVTFLGISSITGDYTATLTDYSIFANATTGAINIDLPDISSIDGLHVRLKKEDASINAVTVDGFGGQTIDHELTKILRDHNSAVMLISRGGNWDVMQATPTSFYADMHLHDNISTTVVNTQNEFHAIQRFVDVVSNGFAFTAGIEGATTAFADYGGTVAGTVLATDNTHGLATGDIITLTDTTNYNGIFTVTVVDGNTFYFTDTWVADDAAGLWYQGDYYTASPGTGGLYKIEFHSYGKPDAGTNQDYEFEFFINETAQENVEAARRFSNSSDVGTFGGGGIVTVADGDKLWMGVQSTTGTQNFTFTHMNVVVHPI